MYLTRWMDDCILLGIFITPICSLETCSTTRTFKKTTCHFLQMSVVEAMVKVYVLWAKFLCAKLLFSFGLYSLITLLKYVKHDRTCECINNNSTIQDYVHPDDHVPPTYEMTPGFKPFTITLLFNTQRTTQIWTKNKFSLLAVRTSFRW